MAEERKYNIQNLRFVKKGSPALNPAGRPKKIMPDLVKLTKEEMEDIASMIVKGDIDSLKAIAKDSTQPALRVMLASVAIKIINKGDMQSLDLLLNRLIGKVKDSVDHRVVSVNAFISLPPNGSESEDFNSPKTPTTNEPEQNNN